MGPFGALANESPTKSIADSQEKKQCKSASLATAALKSL
jgi:hypothetical protein